MRLTPSQRIAFNALATYGRTLFGIFFALFSSRWVVNGLGLSDYGLVGVVGAMLVFITFFNTVLGGSIGRYYSFVIGKFGIEPCDSCPELTQWFNTALCVHTVVPLVLLLVGGPIGYYAIGHWLVIPADRITACYYLFSFSLVTTFVSMVSIPFLSFYWSWQRFAEMVLWESSKTVFMFVFAYSILFYPGDRLVYYSCYTMCVMSSITLIQMFRAWRNFKPCQIKPSLWGDVNQLKELMSFSGWQLFGCAGGLLRGQGTAIVINLFFGPKVNGAFNVANQLSAQTGALSGAMVTALMPAVTSAEGAGNEEKVRGLAFQACKFGTFLILFFAIPLALEIKEVLVLWLKQLPPYAAILCQSMILSFILDKLTTGYMPAIMAKGRIALYQVVTGSILIATVPLVYVFAKMGLNPSSVGLAFILATLCSSLSRLYFGHRLVGLRVRQWFRQVLMPIVLSASFAIGAGCFVVYSLPSTVVRLFLTTGVTVTIFGLCGWWNVLTESERVWVRENALSKVFKHR